MRAVDEDEEENFPIKYLQQSSGPGMEPAQSSSSANQLNYSAPEARWEDRLSDLARVEGILKKRKAELQEVDAVLIERRRQLEDVVHKRKIAEGRLRRAEEDAGIIEQRAAETSVELIRAGNQLINLEIKEKALSERQDHVSKTLQAKCRELKEVEDSCDVVKQNVDKLNKDLRCKMEEFENKESQLKDVKSRIQLSLRVEELRQLVAQTEREEKNQQEKYMRVLKEGEKALEEKTFQLARTRNEIQTQMTEFHELNSKINKLRTELKEIELNIRRGKDEAKKLAERRQEEKRIQETKIKEAEEKLVEINNARNESMGALKSHREEFALLRKKIHESVDKMKECEEIKKQKESEFKEMLSKMNEGKTQLENELSRVRSETQAAEESLSQINSERSRATTELQTAREELLASKVTKDSLSEEIGDLRQAVTEKREELRKTTQEIEDASKQLETAKETIAGIHARHGEMVADMKTEHHNEVYPRTDSLPHESSTPRNKKDADDAVISGLQENIKHLTKESEEKQMALEDAKAEVTELREFMETERKNFHKYLLQMASESEAYREHLERLQMEHIAEQQNYSREKNLLLHKAEEHRLKARKLSDELSNLKQNHLQTKHQFNQLRDTLAKDVKELKKHIEGMTTQMKTELARSLRQVESSKEQTSEEIEYLREKDVKMEIQLAAIQQSINTAKQISLTAGKEKAEVSKREQGETLIKDKGVKLLRQQTYLRAQIRQQMSTSAEVLDEERKKAEVSLEGLKNKLKNLEEVISRKDSSVEDFRLKLLRSKVEAEKTADSNKQIDELKRRLRELEDEKDLIKSQRNHLVVLNEGGRVDRKTFEFGTFAERNGDKTRAPSTRLRRSLDSLTDGFFHTKPEKLELELPCRDEVKLNTSLPLEFHSNEASVPPDHEHEPSAERFMSESRDAHKLKRVSTTNLDHKIGDNLGDNMERKSDKKRGFKTEQDSFHKSNSSSRMSRKELSTHTSGKKAFLNSRSTNPEEFQMEKSWPSVSCRTFDSRGPAREETEKHWKEDPKDTARPTLGSASTFADDRKSEFLSSVHRLKNEKVRELELSLQRFFLT